MKKTFIFLALVVFISGTSFVNSSSSTKSKVLYDHGVPQAVQTSFDEVVTDLINNLYPSNNGYNDGAVVWTHEKGKWAARGDVKLLGGSGGGIKVIIGLFKNNGELIQFNYSVIPLNT